MIESLIRSKGDVFDLTDNAQFNQAYMEFFIERDEGNFSVSINVRDEMFKKIIGIHKEAGGHSLKKDREQTAKTVVSSIEEYKKKGATRVDLENYDVAARRKKKITFGRKTKIKRRGRDVEVLRDKKGRFVKRG